MFPNHANSPKTQYNILLDHHLMIEPKDLEWHLSTINEDYKDLNILDNLFIISTDMLDSIDIKEQIEHIHECISGDDDTYATYYDSTTTNIQDLVDCMYNVLPKLSDLGTTMNIWIFIFEKPSTKEYISIVMGESIEFMQDFTKIPHKYTKEAFC